MKIEIKKNCIRSDNRNCHCYGNRKCWGLKWRSTIAGRTRPNFELFERVSGAANQSSAQRTKYNMDYLRRCWLLCFRLFWGRYIWWLSCPEQESNLHSLARTRFWVWRVYQFRHPGYKSCSNHFQLIQLEPNLPTGRFWVWRVYQFRHQGYWSGGNITQLHCPFQKLKIDILRKIIEWSGSDSSGKKKYLTIIGSL